MARSFGQIIGERTLNRVGSNGKAVTVVLGTPRCMKGGDWKCPFRITGYGVKYGYGIDAIQAMTTALEGIRVTLEESGQTFTWLDGEPSEMGFPRLVPYGFGKRFEKTISRVIDRELKHLGQVLERKYKKHSGKRRAVRGC